MIAGVVVGGIAAVRDGQTRDFVLGETGTASEREFFVEQTNRLALVADILMVSGVAAAAVGGGILLFGQFSSADASTDVALVPRRGGAALVVRGTL